MRWGGTRRSRGRGTIIRIYFEKGGSIFNKREKRKQKSVKYAEHKL